MSQIESASLQSQIAFDHVGEAFKRNGNKKKWRTSKTNLVALFPSSWA